MAKFVATDYRITINGTDFSSSLAAATLDISAAEQEVTAFGNTFVQRISGLKDASISLDFHQDFGAASVDAVLFPLLGSNCCDCTHLWRYSCNKPRLQWCVPLH